MTRNLGIDDLLVVAPYNAQVAEIVRRVGDEFGKPRVGTVDEFQGQEAPVAFYSMATSTPEDAPRQMEFLYNGNRLNVAISRAQGVAVLVAQSGAAPRALPYPRADAARQRTLPLCRDGERRRARFPGHRAVDRRSGPRQAEPDRAVLTLGL